MHRAECTELDDSMPDFVLTRYLYPRDEVVVSLVTSLVRRHDLLECYFWAFELLHSGEALFPILWTIYFDFYAELNPRLERYIRQKEREWNTHALAEAAAAVVRNLHRAAPSSTCFCLRMTIATDGVQVNGCDFRAWLKAIDDRDLLAAAHGTYATVRKWSGDTAFSHLAFHLVEQLGNPKSPEALQAHWDTRRYPDDAHALLATIVQLTIPPKPDRRRPQILPTQEHMAWIDQSQDSCPRVDRTLGTRRACQIPRDTGAFQLARDTISKTERLSHTAATRLHWPYFAARSGLWANRIAALGGTPDHTRREVNFPSTEKLDAFYEAFGYEFDEQPREVQHKTPPRLRRPSLGAWCESAGLSARFAPSGEKRVPYL